MSQKAGLIRVGDLETGRKIMVKELDVEINYFDVTKSYRDESSVLLRSGWLKKNKEKFTENVWAKDTEDSVV